MLEFERIDIGEGAGLCCARCGAVVPGTYTPAAQVVAAIDAAAARWTAGPGPNLCLTGPEPFEHPDLPALVSACVAAGAERVALETDAAALSIAANSRGVLSAGVQHLHVRMLAADEAQGDSLGAQRPGRTRDTLVGIEQYRETAETMGLTVAVTVRVPVCVHNLALLPGLVVRAAKARAHGVRLLGAGPLPPSAASVLAAACDTGMVNGIWVEADESLGLPPSHRLHVVSEVCV